MGDEVGDVDGSIARMAKNAGAAVPRFLVPDLGSAGARVPLPRDEAHHLSRVLRLGPGARVSVFDGRGHEWLAEVLEAKGESVVVVLIEAETPAGEPVVPFDFVQALLKTAAMDEVVRDATMMGARRIVPLLTDHVAVRVTASSRAGSTERWRRIAVASAKQCRRAVVPEVVEPVTLGAWLDGPTPDLKMMFVEPSTGSRAVPMRTFFDAPAPADAALLVGPEGGWSRDEIALAQTHDCALVTLGALTLRADAMCIAAASAFRLVWEG